MAQHGGAQRVEGQLGQGVLVRRDRGHPDLVEVLRGRREPDRLGDRPGDLGDLERMGELGVLAEVQPFHISDDMRWMEERIGRDRSRGAYAFRRLWDAGAVVYFINNTVKILKRSFFNLHRIADFKDHFGYRFF